MKSASALDRLSEVHRAICELPEEPDVRLPAIFAYLDEVLEEEGGTVPSDVMMMAIQGWTIGSEDNHRVREHIRAWRRARGYLGRDFVSGSGE